MKKIILLVFLLIGFIMKGRTQVIDTIRLDVDNARGGSASQVFDSIEFIPLETTKQSLFGSIDQLEITDSFFIILDVQSKSILIFKRDGTFHKRITATGKDKLFWYFTIDKKHHQIEVISGSNDKILVYDMDGNLVNTFLYPKDATAIYDFGDGRLLYNLRRTNVDRGDLFKPFDLVYADKSGIPGKYLNPFNPRVQDGYYNTPSDPINFSGEEGSCMFSIPFTYDVYQLDDTGIIHQYYFNFPLAYSLPINFATDSAYKGGKRVEYVYRDHSNANKISSISSVYKVGNYLLFSAENNVLRIDAPQNYLYNFENNSLTSLARVTGDSSSYYFPVLNTSLDRVCGVHKGTVYTYIPSVRILANADHNEKKITYPSGLNELIKTGSKMNNPVIVQFRLKPGL